MDRNISFLIKMLFNIWRQFSMGFLPFCTSFRQLLPFTKCFPEYLCRKYTWKIEIVSLLEQKLVRLIVHYKKRKKEKPWVPKFRIRLQSCSPCIMYLRPAPSVSLCGNGGSGNQHERWLSGSSIAVSNNLPFAFDPGIPRLLPALMKFW